MEDLPFLEFSSKIPDFQTKKLLSKKKIEDFGETISKKLYQLFSINEYLSSKYEIRVFDEAKEDNLFLFHYIYPGKEVNHIRGLVVSIENGECSIVARSFPFSEDVLIEDVQEKKMDLPFSKTSVVTEVLEGTVLRIFQGRNTKKWYVSTHKKLDGRKSRWSGDTFGKMMEEVWQRKGHPSFEDSAGEYLSSEYCYIFLLSHPENRLVCTISHSLTLVGRNETYSSFPGVEMCGNGCSFLLKSHPSIQTHIPVSREDYSIYTFDDLIEYVRNIPWERSMGVFVYEMDQQNRFQHYFKLTHYEYMKRRMLRGNEPNLKLRYLEFKMESTEYLFDFLELFSDRAELFEEVDKNIKNVFSHLKKCYNRRYKNRETCVFPQEEHIALQKIRRWYDDTLSLEENIERGVWRNCTPRELNTLIKIRKREEDLS